MAEVKVLPEPARSCEQCLAIRSQVSPPRARQHVRHPAPVIPTRNQELRELLTYPFPEPLWARIGQEALDDNEPIAIAVAIAKLAQRKAEDLAWHAARRAAYARLIPQKVA
jgi:hypothetical protein